MKLLGWLLLGGGLVLVIVSFLVPNTVDTARPTSYDPLSPDTVAVFNLVKAQLQIMLLHSGCASFVAGAVLAGAGTIAERLGASKEPSAGDSAAMPQPEMVSAQPAAATRPPLTPEEVAAQRRALETESNILVGGVVLVILLIVIFAVAQAMTPPRTPVAENLADGAAANISAEPDNMSIDAEVENLAASSNPFAEPSGGR